MGTYNGWIKCVGRNVRLDDWEVVKDNFLEPFKHASGLFQPHGVCKAFDGSRYLMFSANPRELEGDYKDKFPDGDAEDLDIIWGYGDGIEEMCVRLGICEHEEFAPGEVDHSDLLRQWLQTPGNVDDWGEKFSEWHTALTGMSHQDFEDGTPRYKMLWALVPLLQGVTGYNPKTGESKPMPKEVHAIVAEFEREILGIEDDHCRCGRRFTTEDIDGGRCHGCKRIIYPKWAEKLKGE